MLREEGIKHERTETPKAQVAFRIPSGLRVLLCELNPTRNTEKLHDARKNNTISRK